MHLQARDEARGWKTEALGERDSNEMRGERDVVLERGVQRRAVGDRNQNWERWAFEDRVRRGVCRCCGVVFEEEVECRCGSELVRSASVYEVAEKDGRRDAQVVPDVPPEREIGAGFVGRRGKM